MSELGDPTAIGGEHNLVAVAIHTTSGSYPATAHVHANAAQKVRVVVDKATTELHITDTSGWIALVGENPINLDASYEAQGLGDTVDIDWGPEEGGGGRA